ncbi:MAG: hypothetical protein RR914_06800 [Oscillospiraceae bacterium]
MGDRNIKKETKKPKKSSKTSSSFSVDRPVAVQPELIKKEKKSK